MSGPCTEMRSDRMRNERDELVAALKYYREHAQCSCTVAERESGHLLECWMPLANQLGDDLLKQIEAKS